MIEKSEFDVPNQHDVKQERLVPMSLEDEVKHLRQQVTELQARGTKQLIDARAAAFEMAAQKCDWLRTYPCNSIATASMAALCADEIRKLAKAP